MCEVALPECHKETDTLDTLDIECERFKLLVVQKVHILLADLLKVVLSLYLHRLGFYPLAVLNITALCGYLTDIYLGVNNKKSQDYSSFSTARIDNNIQGYEDYAKQYDKNSQEYTYYMFQANYYRNLKQFIENMDDATKAKYKEVGGTPSLDGNYTVFGQTVDGFDVLDKISAVEVETNDAMGGKEVSKPKTEIIIEKVEIKDYE